MWQIKKEKEHKAQCSPGNSKPEKVYLCENDVFKFQWKDKVTRVTSGDNFWERSVLSQSGIHNQKWKKEKEKEKKNWWQRNHEDFKKNNACLKGNSLQHAHRITDSGAVFLLGVRHQLGYTRSSRYIELAGPSLLMLPRPPLSSHLPALLRPLLKTSYSTMAPGRNNRVFVIGVGMTKVLLSCICIVIVHRRRERPNTWL